MSTRTRLVQSLNYTLHAREVGVMNVYQQDGAVVAQLSVFDPATSGDEVRLVRVDDELAIGGVLYRVVDAALAGGDERAWLEIAPIG